MSSRALGINKDLEPLAREVRRRGGAVEITNSNHVRWTLPDGQVMMTGLTMNGSAAREQARKIRGLLDPVTKLYDVDQVADKFLVINTETREPVTNAAGYPSSFGSEITARGYARRLNAQHQAGT